LFLDQKVQSRQTQGLEEIIQDKYNTQNLNMFACRETQASPFWKGVVWDLNATKFGYQWLAGDGNIANFWEDP
jgi:hypothetical protein